MKPSNNWTTTLIKLIQESKAETGKEFYQFLNDLWLEDMGRVFDSHLIKSITHYINKYYVPKGDLEDQVVSTKVGGNQADKRCEVTENTSDGYHTFKELYEFRLLYNASLFNAWVEQRKFNVYKSRLHADGEYPFGKPDWFIVGAELPTGQITNHYEMKHWDLFVIPEVPRGTTWDGHTAQDVANRLRQWLEGNDLLVTNPETTTKANFNATTSTTRTAKQPQPILNDNVARFSNKSKSIRREKR